MDVIHVAAALTLRSRQFVTFDDRQRQLAERAGLQVL
jgi:predicted nucleic acid-binding protein